MIDNNEINHDIIDTVLNAIKNGVECNINKLTEGMRDVTAEEAESINAYLERTSKKTGVNIYDLMDKEDWTKTDVNIYDLIDEKD